MNNRASRSPSRTRGARPGRHDRRGVALLIALSVLVMLAMLGSVFATLAGVERSVARNYIDKVRARMLANTGLEHAIAHLGPGHWKTLDIWDSRVPLPWVYHGMDVNANGIVDPGEPATYAGGTLPTGEQLHDSMRVPLEEALRPSFPFDRDGNGTYDAADLVRIGDRVVGISGHTGVGTYAPQGDVYSLKAIDLSSRININNPNPNLGRILNALAPRLGLSPTLGDIIIGGRDGILPEQRFAHINQLLALIGADALERLRPFITLYGWEDPDAVRPLGLEPGKRRVDFQIGDSVYAYRDLRPRAFSRSPEATSFEPRSPININTAPYEVLASVIEGLQGFFIKEIPNIQTDDYVVSKRHILLFEGNNPATSGQVGIVRMTPAIGPRTAENIAREIIKARGTLDTGTTTVAPDPRTLFRSHGQLGYFFDRLPDSAFDAGELAFPENPVSDPSLDGPVPGVFPSPNAFARDLLRDVLKANFDPNCHLNELNPDEIVNLRVDKTDLTFWSFEFCFIPMGVFEVESLGRVIDAQGREVAQASVTAVMRLFDVHRESTQADFLRDYARDGENLLPKLGHTVVYPEPTLDRARIANAIYDGYIGLSPSENLGGGQGADLRARFNGTLAAEPTVGPVADPGGGPWTTPLVGAAEAGSLLPDGVFSEKDSTPGFPNAHFNQHAGTVAMWVKPAFDPEYAGKRRYFFSLQTYDLSNDQGSDWTVNPFGLAYLPHHGMLPPDGNRRNKSEDNSLVSYASGSASFFWRSLVGGYAGAYRRGTPTWHNQADITTTFSEDRTGRGIMADRIAVNGSPTLNHAGHDHDYYEKGLDAQRTWGNLMKRGRWIHLGMHWNDTIGGDGRVRLYLNGVAVPWRNRDETGQNFACKDTDYQNLNSLWGPPFGPVDADGHQQIGAPGDTRVGVGLPAEIPVADKFLNGVPEPPDIRLGAVAQSPRHSAWSARRYDGASARYGENYPADATIDEVFLWAQKDEFEKVQDIWMEGRFYKSHGPPDKSAKGAPGTNPLASFVSSRFRLQPPTRPARVRPPGGTALLPEGTTATDPSITTDVTSGTTGPARGGKAAGAVRKVRLGLVTYTLRVPDYARLAETFPNAPTGPDGRPTYPRGVPRPKVYFDILDAVAKESLLANSAVIGYTDPDIRFELGGGAITWDATPAGRPLDVDASLELWYKIWIDSGFSSNNAMLNSPYTASPIVDDVTITYAYWEPEILSWTIDH